MDKRYQVFVSSTFADLEDARKNVIQTLMEMDCIPAGMELFPAMDEDQFEFIKRVIDDCDYYLLIIGGRYGSVTDDGVSYTEKEFDYALSKGLRPVVLVHGDPDSIPAGKTDKSDKRAAQLVRFRERAKQGRLVKFWSTADELPGIVALSLTKTMKMHPAVGWVRGGTSASTEILQEINDLRKRNAELEAAVARGVEQIAPIVPNMAGLEDHFTVGGTYMAKQFDSKTVWTLEATFGEFFRLIAPYLLQPLGEGEVRGELKDAITYARIGHSAVWSTINDQDFQTLKVQLKALGLIDIKPRFGVVGGGLDWTLTPAGERLMVELRVVRKAEPPAP